jgi:hypothetical protein
VTTLETTLSAVIAALVCILGWVFKLYSTQHKANTATQAALSEQIETHKALSSPRLLEVIKANNELHALTVQALTDELAAAPLVAPPPSLPREGSAPHQRVPTSLMPREGTASGRIVAIVAEHSRKQEIERTQEIERLLHQLDEDSYVKVPIFRDPDDV